MKRQGLTRVETVATLAIVAGTAALLLPATAQFGIFFQARENARRSSCQSNLRQLALGVAQYVQDYDETMPRVTGAPKVVPVFGSSNYGWADALQPYLKSLQFMQCPSERTALGVDPMRRGYTDYWFNRRLSGALVYARTSSLQEVNYPAQTIAMGDGDGNSPQSNARYNIDRLPKSWLSTPGSPARRHLDGANYAFADGHVKWILPREITTSSPRSQAGRYTFALR